MSIRHIVETNTTAVNKFLKKFRTSANLRLLEKFQEDHPECHWTHLRYDKTNDTILHIACRLGCYETVKYILYNYEDSDVDFHNRNFKTPLHEAAQFGHFEIVKCLLEKGACVHELKCSDWTPLMLACTKLNEDKHLDEKDSSNRKECSDYRLVKLLLVHGANANVPNKDGWTALHIVAREGNVPLLELLIDYNVNLECQTKNGRSALHIAALHGHKGMVQKLLDLKVDVNIKDKCGNTSLHESILGENLKICELLIQSGADVSVRNNADFTILHLAASKGVIDIAVYIICVLKFDINITTNAGLAPMHCAARNKQMKMLEYLAKNGADAYLEDKFGRTPFDYSTF